MLADFITECTIHEEPKKGDPILEDLENQWTIYVDGVSNTNGSRVWFIFISPERWDIQYNLRFKFSSTNNEAKYKVLLASITIAKESGVKHLKVYSNFWLVVSHVLKEYEPI